MNVTHSLGRCALTGIHSLVCGVPAGKSKSAARRTRRCGRQMAELRDSQVTAYITRIGTAARTSGAGREVPVFLHGRELPRDQRVLAAGRPGLDQPRRAACRRQRITGRQCAGARDRAHRAASCGGSDDEGDPGEVEPRHAWRDAGQCRWSRHRASRRRNGHQWRVPEVQPRRRARSGQRGPSDHDAKPGGIRAA